MIGEEAEKSMSLRNVLKHRDTIYGFLAIWIVLFHINRRLGEPIQIPVFSQWVLCGNMAVDIFMFFSGCCLFLSIDLKYDVKEFYSRRFSRLIPSYLLISVPFWFWRSLIEAPRANGEFHLIRFFADVSSATFWLKGIETTWFVYAILLFYIMLPAIYKIISRGTRGAFMLLFLIYTLNIAAIYFFVPLYEYSSIAWTRLPIFVIGAISGKYIDKLDLMRYDEKTRFFLVGGGTGLLIFSLFVFPVDSLFTNDNVRSEFLWLLYGPLTVCAVVLPMFISGLVHIRENHENLVTIILNKIGKMTLELYMAHIIILHWFTYYGVLEILGLLSFLIILLLAVLWAYVVRKIISVAMSGVCGAKN